jgi:hypothetical protein
LTAPDGKKLPVSEILGWNASQDWALLRVPEGAGEPAVRAAAPAEVGDRCFFLEASGDGSRVIIDTAIAGLGRDGDLTVAERAGEASYGGPVWNEEGELLAVLAGQRVAGAKLSDLMWALPGAATSMIRGTRARPLPPLPAAGQAARRLQDLLAEGVFVRPLVQTPHFVSGVLGTGVDKDQGFPVARDQKTSFRRAEGQVVAFLTWNPAEKEDTTSHFALYDSENRQIGESELRQLKLRKKQPFVQYWTITLLTLKPGIYRVDLLKAEDPIWRTFFRISD